MMDTRVDPRIYNFTPKARAPRHFAPADDQPGLGAFFVVSILLVLVIAGLGALFWATCWGCR